MSFDPFTAAIELGKTAVDRLWPDPVKRAEEMRKLEELRQNGNLAELNARVQLLLGQLEITKEEAKHKSLFVAGWRPAVGWVGATSLALAYIPKAIVLTAIWTYQCILLLKALPEVVTAKEVANLVLPAFPDLGIMDILGLLGSMLGIGAMRSYDKKNKTETNALGDN